jgi:sulfhydrogenase subunit gamma (sulfur reductase)
MRKNVYLPNIATIKKIEEETADTSTFTVVFDDQKVLSSFSYLPGQFVEVTAFGKGECPVSITSTPTKNGYLELCIRSTGKVTDALHNLDEGGKIGIRGPYGNSFPLDEVRGKDIILIGGGIGLAPLRSLLNYLLDRKKQYGKIELFYGAKTPNNLCFRREYDLWNSYENMSVYITVDKAAGKWNGRVGFVTELLKEIDPSPHNRVAFVCGPAIMIKLTANILTEMRYEDSKVITTLERKMKCGVGKCMRCSIGEKLVCQDGPVFSLRELNEITDEFSG